MVCTVVLIYISLMRRRVAPSEDSGRISGSAQAARCRTSARPHAKQLLGETTVIRKNASEIVSNEVRSQFQCPSLSD